MYFCTFLVHDHICRSPDLGREIRWCAIRETSIVTQPQVSLISDSLGDEAVLGTLTGAFSCGIGKGREKRYGQFRRVLVEGWAARIQRDSCSHPN